MPLLIFYNGFIQCKKTDTLTATNWGTFTELVNKSITATTLHEELGPIIKECFKKSTFRTMPFDRNDIDSEYSKENNDS